MTTEIAKRKICPMLSGVAMTPSDDLIEAVVYCKVEECMLWMRHRDQHIKGHCGLDAGSIHYTNNFRINSKELDEYNPIVKKEKS